MIAGLPYDAEVEYLESTGTQWIDTGIRCVDGQRTSIRFRFTQPELHSTEYVFGASISRSMYYHIGHYYNAGYGRDAFSLASYSAHLVADSDINWHEVVLDSTNSNRYVSFDNAVTLDTSTFNPDGTLSLVLFSRRQNSTAVASNAYAQVSSCSIRNTSTGQLLLDLIPVRFTNELGQSEGAMYDRVSKKLFRNQGTGAFVIGQDVAVPVMGLHFMRRPRYTAKDYVQAGLVAMWDGIENAGWGVHDPNATVWKELVSGTDCAIVGNLSTDYSWSGKSLVRNTGSRGYFLYDATARLQDSFRNATFTVETTTSQPVNNANWQAQIINICQTSQTGVYSKGIIARWRRENSGTMGSLSGSTYPSGAGLTLTTTGALANFACAYNSGQYVSYLDGEQESTGSATPDSTIAGVWVRSGSISYAFRGHYHSVRIYSRALTAAEIGHNYAVDKERFNLP